MSSLDGLVGGLGIGLLDPSLDSFGLAGPSASPWPTMPWGTLLDEENPAVLSLTRRPEEEKASSETPLATSVSRFFNKSLEKEFLSMTLGEYDKKTKFLVANVDPESISLIQSRIDGGFSELRDGIKTFNWSPVVSTARAPYHVTIINPRFASTATGSSLSESPKEIAIPKEYERQKLYFQLVGLTAFAYRDPKRSGESAVAYTARLAPQSLSMMRSFFEAIELAPDDFSKLHMTFATATPLMTHGSAAVHASTDAAKERLARMRKERSGSIGAPAPQGSAPAPAPAAPGTKKRAATCVLDSYSSDSGSDSAGFKRRQIGIDGGGPGGPTG